MGIHRQKGDQVARGSVPDFLPIDFVILGEWVNFSRLLRTDCSFGICIRHILDASDP